MAEAKEGSSSAGAAATKHCLNCPSQSSLIRTVLTSSLRALAVHSRMDGPVSCHLVQDALLLLLLLLLLLAVVLVLQPMTAAACSSSSYCS
jgi:hypothetical protein